MATVAPRPVKLTVHGVPVVIKKLMDKLVFGEESAARATVWTGFAAIVLVQGLVNPAITQVM